MKNQFFFELAGSERLIEQRESRRSKKGGRRAADGQLGEKSGREAERDIGNKTSNYAPCKSDGGYSYWSILDRGTARLIVDEEYQNLTATDQLREAIA